MPEASDFPVRAHDERPWQRSVLLDALIAEATEMRRRASQMRAEAQGALEATLAQRDEARAMRTRVRQILH